MPTQAVSCGVPQSILQNVVWALPASRHFLTTQVACEVSLDNSTYIAAPAAATNAGVDSSWAFIRCTTGNTIVSCKKA